MENKNRIPTLDEFIAESTVNEAVASATTKEIAAAVVDTIKNKMGGKLTPEIDLTDMIEDYAQHKHIEINDMKIKLAIELIKRELK